MTTETNASILSSISTTWGHPDREIDTRTLRHYCGLLARLQTFGEVLFYALLVVNAVAILAIFFTTAWEAPILYDGTDLVCIYDNVTQQTYRAQ
ncbi:MAG: hypothetical protein FWF12_05765 [Betaproteobacteria bacterium]|nr:hypothetical protein [Betaproteobacteria bacterium]